MVCGQRARDLPGPSAIGYPPFTVILLFIAQVVSGHILLFSPYISSAYSPPIDHCARLELAKNMCRVSSDCFHTSPTPLHFTFTFALLLPTLFPPSFHSDFVLGRGYPGSVIILLSSSRASHSAAGASLGLCRPHTAIVEILNPVSVLRITSGRGNATGSTASRCVTTWTSPPALPRRQSTTFCL